MHRHGETGFAGSLEDGKPGLLLIGNHSKMTDMTSAMSTGTDVAMHAAALTLMRGDPLLVADALDISRRTYRKIQQGLFWAFAYNVVGIPLAASGHLNPMVGGRRDGVLLGERGR